MPTRGQRGSAQAGTGPLTADSAQQQHDAPRVNEAILKLVRDLARQQARADFEAEQAGR